VLVDNRAFLRFLRQLGAFNEQTHDGVLPSTCPSPPHAAVLPEGPETERPRWAWRPLADALKEAPPDRE
jgi:hypothetical protein